MPEHVGEGDDRRRDLALNDLDVGVAEAAGFHLEKDLSWPGLWPVSVYGFQRLVISFEEPCFHGVTLISYVDELNECRMSNKEFRMTKFNDLDYFLRRSSFDIRHSAVRS